MKFLTLNTHSWMEKEAEEKFQLLLEDILDKDYDLILFPRNQSGDYFARGGG